MHAKPDLRVLLKWMIAGSGSVITDVIQIEVSRAQPSSASARTRSKDGVSCELAELVFVWIEA